MVKIKKYHRLHSSRLILILFYFCISFIQSSQASLLEDKSIDESDKLLDVEHDIKNIDSQISEQAKILKNINSNISENNNKKQKLEAEKNKKNIYLRQQKDHLIKQLQAIYIINRNNNIKKLFNMNNIQQLNRLTTYLHNYNKQNINNINNIKLSLVEIDNINSDLTALNDEHAKYKEKITDSYNEFRKLKNINLELKNRLQLALKNANTSLSYNTNNHKKLNVLLVDNSNENYDQNIMSRTFAKAKGLLSVPVSGIIDTNFKNKQNTKAIFIKTAEGQEVKAVFNGKVVFSDWLRGFGFLTIISHNNKYMSLYGHNQALLKKTGETVKAGEVIALTGSSGGINQSGLYFEIRNNGNPVNPLAWLKTDLRNIS